MKIVSQFSDYYDHIAESYYSPGSPKVEFHRKTENCSTSQIYRVREKLTQQKVESIRYFSDKKDSAESYTEAYKSHYRVSSKYLTP